MKIIPISTVRRLCICKRYLEKIQFMGRKQITSKEISDYTGIKSYLFRKDLNHLGEVGTAGRGYNVSLLIQRISFRLGLNRERKCVVAGAGAFGTAVIRYFSTFKSQYTIKAFFDIDNEKIGKSILGIPILPIEKANQVIKKNLIDIGIIAVTPSAAQKTAEIFVNYGIRAIMNFTPVILILPESISRSDIDFSIELEMLSYLLAKNKKKTFMA